MIIITHSSSSPAGIIDTGTCPAGAGGAGTVISMMPPMRVKMKMR